MKMKFSLIKYIKFRFKMYWISQICKIDKFGHHKYLKKFVYSVSLKAYS